MNRFDDVFLTKVLGLPQWYFTATRMGEDPRGQFVIPVELSVLEPALARVGWPLHAPVRQLNISVSNEALTARGAHVSNTGKICFVLAGSFTCAVVDLRLPKHDTFGQAESFFVDYISGMAFYVPPGFGNCLMSLEPGSMYAYALVGDFDPTAEKVVSMDDIPVNWPQPPSLISAKDQAGLTLEEYVTRYS